jgi:hypothetical protein
MTAQSVVERIPAEPGEQRVVEWVPVEPWPGPPPVPVLAPYLGMVGAVLCAVAGCWLLLAPYALDYRRGASRVPRATAIDLETGAAAIALGLVTAALFGATLLRRLRAAKDPAAVTVDPLQEESPEAASLPQTAPVSVPTPAPVPPPASTPEAPPSIDPGGSLRDLLTPLVAALAADLRSREEYRPGGAPDAGQPPPRQPRTPPPRSEW